MSDDAPAEVSGQPSLRRTIQTVSSVIAPTTLLTVLLFYFGWVSVSTQAAFFGFDYSLLGFSTRDYLLQSISAVYLPLAAALLLAAILYWSHSWLAARVWAGPALRRLSAAFVAAGVGLLAVGLFETTRGKRVDPVSPLCFAGCVGLLGYAAYLHRRSGRAEPPAAGSPPRAMVAPYTVIVSLLITLTAFWAVAEYGQWEGTRKAEQLAANLPSSPDVVVYSPKRLFLRGAGVGEEQLHAPDAAYSFRYDGLRLLIRSNDRFFLVPAGWSRADGVTIVLRDAADLRLEFDLG